MKTEIKFMALLALVLALIMAHRSIIQFVGAALFGVLAYLALNTTKGRNTLNKLMQINDKMEERMFGKH